MNAPARALAVAGLLAALSVPLDGAGPARKLFTYEQVFALPAGPPGAVGAGAGILGRLPDIQGWLDDGHYLERREDPADKQMKTYAVSVADGS
ncbi:MAG TPA: hypothetical protein PLN93_03710, partial [Vicinamibacterales bacterium]|nr:hypothetical protein [Vicinamibacterales bacterium]